MKKKIIVGAIVLFLAVALFHLFVSNLEPLASPDAAIAPAVLQIRPGEGFRATVSALKDAGVIKSVAFTEWYALLDGRAFSFQPGLYRLSPASSTPQILAAISGPTQRTATVTIPEGANMFQIDVILSDALVIKKGDLIAYAQGRNLEGTLFPDTYQFYTNADVAAVVQKMTSNFQAKAFKLLPSDPVQRAQALILASILEKEVPDSQDQRIVAGILLKRAKAGMPLDVDATACYAAQLAAGSADASCSALDLKIDSAYNTYLYKGFPPGPIGNPGISAIQAATAPKSSPYWFYLSDPKTGKTVFAKTLDEQHQNTVKYLDSG